MLHTQGSRRKAVLAGLLTIALASGVSAQTSAPATGLGQAWPNAADVSTAPNWHVYVFHLHGIKYVQVNDLGGTVHAAIATANGTTIVLPVGVDAKNVITEAQSCASYGCSGPGVVSQTQTAQTIYKDASTTITATPQSSGATAFAVQSAQLCPEGDCSGGNVARAIP